MNLALRITLWVEIALGVFWTISAAMAHGAGGGYRYIPEKKTPSTSASNTQG
jgi:hypothetical protein